MKNRLTKTSSLKGKTHKEDAWLFLCGNCKMSLSINLTSLASSPLYAGLAAAFVIIFMNVLYKWKTSDKLQTRSIAYNSLIGFVLVALTVMYTKKSLLIPDEYLDTRPPPF